LVKDTRQQDDEFYFNLSIDDEINKLWGYDYRDDLGDKAPTKEYFSAFRENLAKSGEEFSLTVFLKGTGERIGELVVWNIGFYNDVEIGFRFLPAHQGKGYAYESASALIKYLKEKVGVKKIKDRAFKENAPSNKLINKLGFTLISEDDKKYYYEMKF